MNRSRLLLFPLAGLCLAAASPYMQTRSGQEADPDKAKSAWEYLSKRYDADGDGQITFEEYGRSEEHFGRLDRDGSGSIESSDVATSRSRGGRGQGRGNRSESTAAPLEGQVAPDFTLEVIERAPSEALTLHERAVREAEALGEDPPPEPEAQLDAEGKPIPQPKTIQLSDYAQAGKPVALIFGSYT